MAAKAYRTADGKRVPSVTTILAGIGWNKDALLYWANQQGLEGRTLEESRKAADVGTVVHAMIEAHGNGRTLDISGLDDDMRGLAETAFGAFVDWIKINVHEVIAQETSIVSESLRIGGTFDRVFRNSAGQICMMDWKSAAAIYEDHLMQDAAYGRLWNEAHPDMPIERYELLRLSKASGAFTHASFPAERIAPFWDAFACALELHGHKNKLKALMK